MSTLHYLLVADVQDSAGSHHGINSGVQFVADSSLGHNVAHFDGSSYFEIPNHPLASPSTNLPTRVAKFRELVRW